MRAKKESHNIKACLGTLFYLSQKAQQDNLVFLEAILKNAIADIEAGLSPAGIEKEEVVDSELVSVLQFTDLLANCSDSVLDAFLEAVDENETAVNSKKACH